MPCRNCIELQQFLHSAVQPDSPALLVGLSEAAIRNRIKQKKEKIAKLQLDLERHSNSCPETAGLSLATI
jgi:hypothetical protein